jgi:hypothetical protein
MDTLLPLLFSIAAVAGLWSLLERTHRRTEHLSRTPFGADLEGDRDITRTLAEIEAVRARQPRLAPRRGPASSTGRAPRQGSENHPGASHLRAV